MRSLLLIVTLAFILVNWSYSQNNHSEIGIDIQAASFSTHGGTVGGAVRYAFVNEGQIAFGPTFRFQHLWSNDQYYGTKAKYSMYGGGGYLHFRFLEWLYLGAEIEVLRNHFNTTVPENKFRITMLGGGGICHDFGPIVLNFGLLYDFYDLIRDPYTTNSSPLSRDYFLKKKVPSADPNAPAIDAGYVPLIYRFSLFIPLNKNRY